MTTNIQKFKAVLHKCVASNGLSVIDAGLAICKATNKHCDMSRCPKM